MALGNDALRNLNVGSDRIEEMYRNMKKEYEECMTVVPKLQNWSDETNIGKDVLSNLKTDLEKFSDVLTNTEKLILTLRDLYTNQTNTNMGGE